MARPRQESQKMDTVPKLINNQSQNPFSDSIELFLQTQLHLEGMLIVTSRVETKWTSGVIKAIRDLDGKLIVFKESYNFFPDSEEHFKLLRSYLFNVFVAQTVESVETLLKNFILHMDSTQTKKRTNKERLRILSTCIKPSGNFRLKFEKDTKLFLLIEQVRHMIVHTDQLIMKSSKRKIPDMRLFREYFETSSLGANKRIIINYEKASLLNKCFTDFGFRLFNLLSEKFKYPIKTEKGLANVSWS